MYTSETKLVPHVYVLIRAGEKWTLWCKSSCHSCPALHRGADGWPPVTTTSWLQAT